MAATQKEVHELAQRLRVANDVAEMQAQQIAELQRQAQQARDDAAAGRAAGANPQRGDNFGANRIVDTRVLGRPDNFDGTPGSWRLVYHLPGLFGGVRAPIGAASARC